MTTQAIFDHYNQLYEDAARKLLPREEEGLIITANYSGIAPSDYGDVCKKIDAAIRAEYPQAMADELQQAAAAGRRALSWARDDSGNFSSAWIHNQNLGGKLAVTRAQPAIQKIMNDSQRVRTERYEQYRKAVEQGVALPPPAKKCKCTTQS